MTRPLYALAEPLWLLGSLLLLMSLLLSPLGRLHEKESLFREDDPAAPASLRLDRLAAPPLALIHVLGGTTVGDVRAKAVAAAEATLL